MISVLLATYNGEKYIKESIDSILNQSFREFELLIGLNGTTDNSVDIIKKYSDRRIRVFDYGEDKGKSKTLNKLLKEAKYDIICLQDDDDLWVENKLEKQLNFIGDYDVVGGLIQYINENGEIIGTPNLSLSHHEIVYRSFLGDNQIANTSAMFKRKQVLEVGGWDQNKEGIEDFHLWIRLMKIGRSFINVPDFIVKHRLHSNSNFNTKNFNIQDIITFSK